MTQPDSMKKALIVATVGRFLNFEKNDIKILRELGYEVHCAMNCHENERDPISVEESGVIAHQIDFARSPFSKQSIAAYRQLRKLLAEEDFRLIHCHTPMGGFLGRAAARKYRKHGTKVLYTAHGFHFFRGAPLRNWLLYFPAEWLCSWLTDVQITINHEDYELAKKHFHAGKVVYIPGVGIDTKKFAGEAEDSADTRATLGLKEDDIMLLSVGELNANKNHAVVAEALSRLDDRRIHYFVAGVGEEGQTIGRIAKDSGVSAQVHLLGYRADVPKLLKAADAYVHPSYREGLSTAVMEAMAAGLPVIASDIRGVRDLIAEGRGGILADPHSPDTFASAIIEVMDYPHIRKEMGEYNLTAVQPYDQTKVEVAMREIYGEIAGEQDF